MSTTTAETQPGLRMLRRILTAAVLVSIVHYIDNYANFADYPVPTSGPAPSATVIAVSWFVLTAFGVAGFVLFARGRVRAAVLSLAVYSTSGLVGIGHYTVAGATDMPWWRQAHVMADIACGGAVLAFVAWTVRRRRLSSSPVPIRQDGGACAGRAPRPTREP